MTHPRATIWEPIEKAPFTKDSFGYRWLHWCLLARQDIHGWVVWVGGMDADTWLGREDDRSCWQCGDPTHFKIMDDPSTPIPVQEVEVRG